MNALPTEIMHIILGHLRPPILTTRADEAACKFTTNAWNWWSP
ncbi:14572_t:CDS:1, partial [Acaulospora colombiana]